MKNTNLTSTILWADGTQQATKPKNGKYFTLKELQNIVGGYIEMVYLPDNMIMVVNEDGRREELKLNVRATEIMRSAGKEVDIVGNVLLCNSKLIK